MHSQSLKHSTLSGSWQWYPDICQPQMPHEGLQSFPGPQSASVWQSEKRHLWRQGSCDGPSQYSVSSVLPQPQTGSQDWQRLSYSDALDDAPGLRDRFLEDTPTALRWSGFSVEQDGRFTELTAPNPRDRAGICDTSGMMFFPPAQEMDGTQPPGTGTGTYYQLMRDVYQAWGDWDADEGVVVDGFRVDRDSSDGDLQWTALDSTGAATDRCRFEQDGRISNCTDPIGDQDVATKKYGDDNWAAGGTPTQEVEFPASSNSAGNPQGTWNDYPCQGFIQGTFAYVGGYIPQDFLSITEMVAVFAVVGSGTALSWWTQNAAKSEAYNTHNDSGGTTPASSSTTWLEIDVSGEYSALAAGDYFSFKVGSGSAGVTSYIKGIRLKYA